MTLRLNNQLVQGKEIRINIKMPFGDADISGSSSSTDTAEEGTKAKELTVNMLIPFSSPAWLSDLVELAESTAENGSRTIYRIGHDAAEAMKFYRAKFVGEVNVNEQSDVNAWLVNFSMSEVLSVPERKSQRETITAARQQSQTENPAPVIESDDVPPNTQLTGFERFLKYVDDSLADSTHVPDGSENETQ